MFPEVPLVAYTLSLLSKGVQIPAFFAHLFPVDERSAWLMEAVRMENGPRKPSRVGLAKMAQLLLPKGVQNRGFFAHLSLVDGRRTRWTEEEPGGRNKNLVDGRSTRWMVEEPGGRKKNLVDGRRTRWMVDAPERDRKQVMEKVSGDVGWQVDGRRMLEWRKDMEDGMYWKMKEKVEMGNAGREVEGKVFWDGGIGKFGKYR